MPEEALYDEIESYLLRLTERQRIRLVCKVYLKFSVNDIARLENTSRQAFSLSINQAKRKIRQYQNHDELVSAIQEMFQKPLP